MLPADKKQGGLLHRLRKLSWKSITAGAAITAAAVPAVFVANREGKDIVSHSQLKADLDSRIRHIHSMNVEMELMDMDARLENDRRFRQREERKQEANEQNPGSSDRDRG